MSKKIGKNPISEELISGLKGFEEVFEDYLESEEYKDQQRKERESKSGDQYELQYFLEQENARLKGLEVFLTKKVPLKINFSQTEKLIKVQEDRKKVLLEKMGPEFQKLTSTLQKNLAHFFNSHFS